ncbi:MAG: CGNR zinc finger domain-containing protein [Proteobacteria bacterium]|nr:MAG: CGNR zinc finger domain-containing protein [Pseudomonadota bacterium]
MALFKGPDTIDGIRVDILSEVYQLDGASKEELLAFAKQKNIIAIRPGSHSMSWLGIDPTAPRAEWDSILINTISRMHTLAVSVMDTLYFEGLIKRSDIEEVNWFRKSFVGPSLLLPEQSYSFEEKNWDNEEKIPLSKTYESTPFNLQLQERFTIEIMALITDHRDECKFPLKQCPGCNSVFRVGRLDQKYCSERCSARVRMRRNREKHKENENVNLLHEGNTVTSEV